MMDQHKIMVSMAKTKTIKISKVIKVLDKMIKITEIKWIVLKIGLRQRVIRIEIIYKVLRVELKEIAIKVEIVQIIERDLIIKAITKGIKNMIWMEIIR